MKGRIKDNIGETELIERAQKGDSEAEEYLIRKYKNMVRMKAQPYFIAGADRDDIVQEGMIGLFKAIRSYSGDRHASFKTFAELCISRQIITAIKTAGRQKHKPLNTYISLSHPIFEDSDTETFGETLYSNSNTDPEARLLLKEVVDFVGINGGKIFSEMELKVWSEYMQGKSPTDISKIINKPTKSVENAIQRSKRKLESYLSGDN
ncbi:MAG: RNA polymerase sporulation sigma factor SigH [Anaerovoracaceae bacterium]